MKIAIACIAAVLLSGCVNNVYVKELIAPAVYAGHFGNQGIATGQAHQAILNIQQIQRSLPLR